MNHESKVQTRKTFETIWYHNYTFFQHMKRVNVTKACSNSVFSLGNKMKCVNEKIEWKKYPINGNLGDGTHCMNRRIDWGITLQIAMERWWHARTKKQVRNWLGPQYHNLHFDIKWQTFTEVCLALDMFWCPKYKEVEKRLNQNWVWIYLDDKERRKWERYLSV